MNNIIGFILSYIGIFSIIIFASILMRTGLNAFYVRKVVHIGVSNWWILAAIFFTNPVWPVAGALSFIIINFISYRRHIFKAMEAAEQKENLGTVYFPISLLILSIICFGGYAPLKTGAAGILVLGYGDGIAAIIGKSLGKRRYHIPGAERSYIGNAAMFAASFLTICAVAGYYNEAHILLTAGAVAAGATIAEAFTPFGLDNISVPLTASLIYSICTGVIS